MTESCDPDTPHLITHVATTAVTVPDVELLAPIHTAVAKKELLPAEHLVDAGYVDAEMLVTSQTEHQVEVIGPAPQDTRWQARAGEGFDVACFTLDWEQEQRVPTEWVLSPGRPAPNGLRPTIATPNPSSISASRPPPAARAPPGRSVRPRHRASSLSAPRRSTWRCSWRGTTKRPRSSKHAAMRAPALRPPSARGCASLICATPAISVSPKHDSNTSSPPPPRVPACG